MTLAVVGMVRDVVSGTYCWSGAGRAAVFRGVRTSNAVEPIGWLTMIDRRRRHTGQRFSLANGFVTSQRHWTVLERGVVVVRVRPWCAGTLC